MTTWARDAMSQEPPPDAEARGGASYSSSGDKYHFTI
jgi:hypothetical protein